LAERIELKILQMVWGILYFAQEQDEEPRSPVPTLFVGKSLSAKAPQERRRASPATLEVRIFTFAHLNNL
jgi:hypothetical protein